MRRKGEEGRPGFLVSSGSEQACAKKWDKGGGGIYSYARAE